MAKDLASRLTKVRNRVLDDHFAIRAELARLEASSVAVERTDNDSPLDAERLRRDVESFVAHFERHLDYEDARLVPIIAALDEWGEDHARTMRKEHRAQRELLRLLLRESASTDGTTLAREIQVFVRSVRAEMNSEERDLRQLGEDMIRAECAG